MARYTNLYLVYDVLAQDVLTVLPAPSDNAALLGFANSKKSFEEKGYNPRLLQLYHVAGLTVNPLSSGCSILRDESKPSFMCDLANAPMEVERITNELLEDDQLSLDDED